LRSWAEQAALYAKGRTTTGPAVTDAPPGHSWHNFGLAIDLVPLGQDTGAPDWNNTHPVWQRLIAVGQTVGLVEGAQFRTFKDWPHFQYTGAFPESPNDAARKLLMDQGVAGVWLAAFPVAVDVTGEISV